jgi:hypothetical protein
LEEPGKREDQPKQLGFVSLNLNECDGTLLDVRHQVQNLDNPPQAYLLRRILVSKTAEISAIRVS